MPTLGLADMLFRPACHLHRVVPGAHKVRNFQTTTVFCQATSGRQRAKLRLPSSPLFSRSLKAADHIIHAPPSSAPNVYHTPLKFLPPNDPRRKMQMGRQSKSATATLVGTPLAAPSRSTSGKGGVIIRDAPQKKYHLTEDDFEQIRTLRAEDPTKWTVSALAEKFNCSKVLITMIAPNASARAKHFEALAEREKERNSRVIADRRRRREMWNKL